MTTAGRTTTWMQPTLVRWVGLGLVIVAAEAVLIGTEAALVAGLVVVAALVVTGVGFGGLPGQQPVVVSSPATVVVLAALAVQTAHFLEHGLQLAHWFANPTAPPYLTPWAADGAGAASDLVGDGGSVGVEVLHLVGNAGFLVGLAAMALLLRARGVPSQSTPWTRRALIWQGLHVTEHVLLTITAATTGTASGLSTGFGLMTGGAVAWSIRIWLHFAINAAATIAALRGLQELRRAGLLGPNTAPPETPDEQQPIAQSVSIGS